MKNRPHNFIDLVGKKFNRWTVLSYSGGGRRLCVCECGTKKKVYAKFLKDGRSKSCGCLARELTSNLKKTHGMSKKRPYRVWANMLNRCYNKNLKNYNRYGGRGITVCEKWKEFDGFWDDMSEGYKKTLKIDRINNDGNYEKSNCRWVTQKQQNNNTSVVKKITFNGKTKTISEWAEELGINRKTLANRIFTLKWTTEEALSFKKLNNTRDYVRKNLL